MVGARCVAERCAPAVRPGAAAAGWTLKQGHNYNWTYIAPDGRKFSNRRTALTVAGPLQVRIRVRVRLGLGRSLP